MADESTVPPASKWVGRACSFTHEGQRLVGVVESAEYVGRTARGDIPDYSLVIRGSSGRTLKISLVESYASFK